MKIFIYVFASCMALDVVTKCLTLAVGDFPVSRSRLHYALSAIEGVIWIVAAVWVFR